MKHLLEADYDSIRHELWEYTNTPTDMESYIDPKKFCETYYAGANPRIVLKAIRFNLTGLDVLRFMLTQEYTITNPIEVYSDDMDARCKVILVKNPTEEALKQRPFYMKDLYGVIDEYAVIDGLESLENGAGMKFLESVLKLFPMMPVIIQAGFLYYGDYESTRYSTELINIPEELAARYEKLGFKNVNNYVGNYEDSIIMFSGLESDYAKIAFRHAAQTLSKDAGDSDIAERAEVDDKSHLAIADDYFSSASGHAIKVPTMALAVKEFGDCMIEYIEGVISKLKSLTAIDKMNAVSQIESAKTSNGINDTMILNVLANVLPKPLDGDDVRKLSGAFEIYNNVVNAGKGEIDIKTEWMPIMVDGALTARHLKNQLLC